jgi:hypothetical protein
MKMNDIYKPKSLEKEEVYRNLISIYYYLLFNNKSDNYYKKIIKYFYKNNTNNYLTFFNDNFLLNQNIFFFTLYNQIPLDFLPLPKSYMYLYYPLITFIHNKDKYYLYNKLEFSESLSSNNKIIDINNYWEKYTREDIKEKNLKIQELKKSLNNIKEENDTDIYDNFQIGFDIEYLKKLPNNFFKNKTIFLFIKNPIISHSFKFDADKNIIILYNYYIKNNNYRYISEMNVIPLENIKFISLYEKITKLNILKCFSNEILKKNTYIYNQTNKENKIDNSKEVNWFTLTPFVRIHDPLYMLPTNEYIYKEFIVTKDTEILNISSNIYLNNIIINNNNKNSFQCFNSNNIKETIKLCDYDFINSNRINTEINYNKKNGLLLIIWKNKKYIDNNTSFTYFLKYLGIESYFNLMSYVKLKNNEIKLLGEEIYIKSPNIKIISDYTDDISKFNLYSQKEKYDKLYYKSI